MLASKQPTIDERARTEISGALRHDLEIANLALEQAEKNDDRDGAAAAKERLNELAAGAQQVAGRSTDRNLDNELERARTSVAKAISGALDEIAAVHPAAHAHLKESLVSPTGSSPSYRPASITIWQVNPTGSSGARGSGE